MSTCPVPCRPTMAVTACNCPPRSPERPRVESPADVHVQGAHSGASHMQLPPQLPVEGLHRASHSSSALLQSPYCAQGYATLSQAAQNARATMMGRAASAPTSAQLPPAAASHASTGAHPHPRPSQLDSFVHDRKPTAMAHTCLEGPLRCMQRAGHRRLRATAGCSFCTSFDRRVEPAAGCPPCLLCQRARV